VVVAIAAGLARLGAGIAVKAADANAIDEAAELVPVAAVEAQPDNSEPIENAPNGNMGAAAIIFRAERREDEFEWGMVEVTKV
jgi:hypothetical protein